MKQDIISYMFNVEDTRTKSMFIMQNLAMYYSHYDFFSTFCPNSNTLISKLDTVYRYTVFNGKPVYGMFYTHIA